MQPTRDRAPVALYATWFNMNSYAGIVQPVFYIHLQVVAHYMRFFHTGILRHYQVQLYITLASRFASAKFMKTHYLTAMLYNT